MNFSATRFNVSITLGLLFAAALMALTHGSLISDSFHPVKAIVDLTHASQKNRLEGPWDLRPDQRFSGIMRAFDEGQPVHILVTLPSVGRYEGRFKFKFHNMAQAIEVRANGILLLVVRPSRLGRAEKFTVSLPPHAVVKGMNRISFTNTGIPGGTEYELVRLQNYSTALVKDQAYWLPSGRVVCRSGFFWVLMSTALAVGCVAAIGIVLVRRGLKGLLRVRWQRLIRQAARRTGPRLINAVVFWGQAVMRFGGGLLRHLWRRLLKSQHPEGYAKVFYLLVSIALVSHWLSRWEPFAKLMGSLAALVLVIAVVWEARLSPSATPHPQKSLERRLWPAVALGAAVLLSPFIVVPATKGFSEANAFFAKPYAAITHSVLSLHTFPLWDPSSGGGESMLADPVAAQFYPPMWITWLAPTAHTALRWIVHLHLVAAAVGSYILACWIGCRPTAALLVPLGFVFNEYVSSMLVNGGIPILYAFTWLSWGTALLWRGTTQDSMRFLVGAGACLAAQVFGGTGYDINFSVLLYGLLLIFVTVARPIPWRTMASRFCRQTTIVFGCAIGFSAVKLLPVLEFLRISNRGGLSLADVEAQPSPTLTELCNLLFSRFFGVLPGGGPEAQWLAWAYTVLVLFALWSFCRKGPLWRPTLLFALSLVVACWVTLGPRVPLDLLAALYYLIPGFRQSAHVPRILIIARLAIPVLAAIGASSLLRYTSTRAPWLRRLPQHGAIAFGTVFVSFAYVPFMSYVTRYPEYGHVERVRTGFLAALAAAPDVSVEESPHILRATVSLKNIGDESWKEDIEIQWRLNGVLFHTSGIPQRVNPGEVAQLRIQSSLPAIPTASSLRLRLSVGTDGEQPQNSEKGLLLALIERRANGASRVTTTPPTVETILSGQGLLGRCPDDWNALLGALSRWHAPDAVRVLSEFNDVYPYTALLHGFQVESYTNSTVTPRYFWPHRWDARGEYGPALKSLRIFNVRYLILPADHQVQLGAHQARLLRAGPQAELYELTSALPRIWCPQTAVLLVGEDDDQDFNALEAKLVVYHPDFDPSGWAIFCRRVPCVDDLTLEELRPFSALVLTHPNIRDPQKAKRLLEDYRNAGGRVVQLPLIGYRYASSRDTIGSMLDNVLPAKALGIGAQAGLAELFASIPSKDPGATRVVVERGGPTAWRLRVDTERDATPVVMSEIYFPGWHAAVDGRRAPLYMADGIIRGVMLVGQGTHTVELWYSPMTWWWGGAVTLGFLIGILILRHGGHLR